MHILIAQFTYSLSEAELRATADQLAPNFADIPGCFEKTWLIDPATSVAGGVYKFRDADSVRAYLASPLWKSVASTPQFTNLTTRVFDTIDGATRTTRGTPAAVLAR